jgi:hypothetical protein
MPENHNIDYDYSYEIKRILGEIDRQLEELNLRVADMLSRSAVAEDACLNMAKGTHNGTRVRTTKARFSRKSERSARPLPRRRFQNGSVSD